jgi:hypothetical protein
LKKVLERQKKEESIVQVRPIKLNKEGTTFVHIREKEENIDGLIQVCCGEKKIIRSFVS